MRAPIETTIFANAHLEHGPRGLLGRVLLKAEAQARARGVTLSFASMADLVATHERHATTWGPLFPGFDPARNALTDRNAFCLLGRNAKGEIVATQAGRLYDWTHTTCYEETRSLRLLYQDPAAQALPLERCEVTAIASRCILGRVFYSGGAWYHPQYRGVGLVEILPRLARALAHGQWGSEFTITLMAEHNVKKGVFPRNGYQNIEWDVRLMNTRDGTLRFALLWIKRQEMLEDLQQFLDGFSEQIGVQKRAANA